MLRERTHSELNVGYINKQSRQTAFSVKTLSQSKHSRKFSLTNLGGQNNQEIVDRKEHLFFKKRRNNLLKITN